MILRCLYGLFAEKRFMLLFGVVYVFFMGALITSQGQRKSVLIQPLSTPDTFDWCHGDTEKMALCVSVI